MKERRFTNKKLIALMLPLAVDQLLNSFMGTVDTLVVSNLGSAAISAVSLVDSINILVVRHVTDHCNCMSFIQQSDSWFDLWSGGTSSHGECKEVFLFFCNVLSIYCIVR